MANWHYFNHNKEKIGPVTGRELKQLALQGTITRKTFVEDPTGRTGLAKDVNGLTFPEAAPSETPQPEPEPSITPNPFTPAPPTSVPVPPIAAKQLFCTNCGNSVTEQAVACMSCGAKPVGHKKFCRQCAATLNPEQVVCIKCGSAINTTGGFNFSGNSMSQASDFLGAHNITVGEVVIFSSAVLVFISFILPWAEATVPVMGKVTSNGFSIYAFFLGLLFIHPVWMALKKKRTLHYKVRGYFWAGIGIIAGIAFPRIAIEGALEVVRQLTSVGAGSYVFIGACIALIVGMALQPRPSSDTKTFLQACTGL